MPRFLPVVPVLTALFLSVGLVPHPARGQTEDETAAARRIIATTALAFKEYALGVVDGRVVLEEEVGEAALFLGEARATTDALPESIRPGIAAAIDTMQQTVADVGDPALLDRLARHVETTLEAAFGGLQPPIPALRPDVALGARLYGQACATCHGDAGLGDGPAGAALDPPPSNLADGTVLSDQAPIDFYRKVMIGVAGTGMPGFEGQLSNDEVWAVVWHASRLRSPERDVEAGRAIVAVRCAVCTGGDLPPLAVLPGEFVEPTVMAGRHDDELTASLLGSPAFDHPLDEVEARQVLAYLRTFPFAPEAGSDEATAFGQVRAELARGLRAASAGDAPTAGSRMLDAYLAFEGVERVVALRDQALAGSLEAAFAEIRGRAEGGETPAGLTEPYRSLDGLLADAERALQAQPAGVGLFAGSFVILLREGIEALLIVGALVAVVTRGGAPERRRDIYLGVAVAIVASFATAYLLEAVFRIGVAQQEMLEGITMLVAAAILVFVGFWLMHQIEIHRWKQFLSQQGNKAIAGGSALALGLAAFLAVYREGFETVLFYKALFITAEGAGTQMVVGGAVAAAVVLGLIYFGITKFGMKIPLRPFFAVTSAILLYMAFTFVGKGITELQEGAIVGTTLLDWAPRVPWMGIYPTAQTMALQSALLALLVAGATWSLLLQPRLRRAEGT